ncbi:ABC transporter substrate-binding protein [Dactylosporangium sp. CA-233914]|uniref:ABC transporter substrate-binding protein n=1 Tax=Dactylosporangium sp. CA-233914 TaxID=3239934 RepID=UPI003D8FDAD1
MGAAAVAVSLTLTGCFTQGNDAKSGDDKPANLTGEFEVVSFYPEGSPEYKRLEGLAKQFEGRFPGAKVKLVFGGGQDVPKIQARWRAGNPPEVNYGFFGRLAGNPDGMKYVEAGQVQPLSDAMSKTLTGFDKPWKDAVLPAVRTLITGPDGTYYAAPESVTTIQFFYNKKVFQQLGVSPPKTLPELFEVADKVKASGVAPFAVTGTFAPYMQQYLDYLLMRRSGTQNTLDAIAGKKDFASLPGAAEAVADLHKMVSSGYFMDGFKSADFTAAQLAFFQGKAAMILMGSWLIGEMKQSIPADFEVGTFAFPTVPGASGDQTGVYGGVNVQTVAKQSKNPALGVEWLRFVAEKSNQEAFVAETGNISGYEGVAAPKGFEAQAEMLKQANAFTLTNLGILAEPAAVKDAYGQAVVKLFFGQADAPTTVQSINDGLKKARG